MEKGSGDMAVPKLFYFPNSGIGQLKYLRSRVRPRNWAQDSSTDVIRDAAAFAVVTGLGEVEGFAIEGHYRICSRSGCFCSPSIRLREKLMLCMSITTLQSSLSVGRLTNINSDCCNAINSYHGLGKSSLSFPVPCY